MATLALRCSTRRATASRLASSSGLEHAAGQGPAPTLWLLRPLHNQRTQACDLNVRVVSYGPPSKDLTDLAAEFS
jgi:hypothetical protein